MPEIEENNMEKGRQRQTTTEVKSHVETETNRYSMTERYEEKTVEMNENRQTHVKQ